MPPEPKPFNAETSEFYSFGPSFGEETDDSASVAYTDPEFADAENERAESETAMDYYDQEAFTEEEFQQYREEYENFEPVIFRKKSSSKKEIEVSDEECLVYESYVPLSNIGNPGINTSVA